MDLWTDEHLSKQAFSSGEMIDDLLKQMEELYTTHFGESGVLTESMGCCTDDKNMAIARKLETS